MPNIMDGIYKMPAEQLSSQLAILQTVTMSNVFSEMGQKASNKTVKVFNGLRKIFDAAPVKEPEVISLDQRIADCKEALSAKTCEELAADTRAILVQKVSSLGTALEKNMSDDALSIYVIEAACKNFKKEINKELSPAQKADAVYQRYNERLISQTQEKYKKASNEEKKKIDAQLQKELNQLSDEQKEELKKALRVDEITGETLKKFLTTSAGAAALMVALNASGFGAFMALTTIMHAVFTTTFGITLPFVAYTTSTAVLSFFLGPAGWFLLAGTEIFMFSRNKNKLIYELLSQVVWASVLECGGRFTPKDESLPSWLPEEQRKTAISDNKEFMDLLNRYTSLQNKFDQQNKDIQKNILLRKEKETEINALHIKIKKQKEEIKATKQSKTQLEQKLDEAKKEFDSQKAYAYSENTQLYQQYIEAEKKLKQAEEAVKESAKKLLSLQEANKASEKKVTMDESEIERVESEKKQLEEENAKLQASLDKMKDRVSIAELKEGKKLKERWEVAYKKFEFDKGVIKDVVKNYEYNEYGYIERWLMELHQVKDPAALSANRGKMAGSGKLHLGISTSTGVASRIFYIPLKNAGGGKTVRITDICKHNDPRYGK